MTSFTDSLSTAARENPLAAGLIGAGIAWMLLGPKLPIGLVRGVSRAPGTFVDAAGSGARRVMSAASSMGDTLSNTVTNSAQAMGDTLESTSRDVGTKVTAAGQSIQETLPKFVEEQPLVVGAIGLALGAVIASAFPATRLETDLVGDASATAKQKLSALSDSAADAAKRAMSAAAAEADRQGLSAEGIQETLGQTLETVKGAVKEA